MAMAVQYRTAPSRISGGLDASEKRRRGAVDWLLVKSGQGHLVEKAKGIRLNPGEFRGMNMLELAKDGLERQGLRARSMDPREVSRIALRPSAMTLPGNRLGTFGALDRVNEAGEFKRKNIPDGEKGTISAGTKGNTIAITRQAIINDELNAFGTLAASLGRAARLSIEVDVFALLALNSGLGPTLSDGKTLFHADHANIAGTPAAPSVASFDAARQQMAGHSASGEYLDLRPAIWLGPTSLGGAARLVNGAVYDPDITGKFQVPNAVAGLFAQVVDTPRLSGTAWYALASPDVAPVFEVVFLNGVEEPFIDTMDTWTIDSVEMKVRLDYGVGAIDYRGAVRNAGA